MEEGLTEIDIERTHKIKKAKQSKKQPTPIFIKFVRYNWRKRMFSIKEKFENTGISIAGSLDANDGNINAKEQLGFRNVFTLAGRVIYLAEGSTKPQDL